MTNNTKMREAFEHHVRTKTIMSLEKFNGGAYRYNSTELAWETWQAAQSVPVEDVVLPIANAYESGIGHCNDNLCNPYKEGSAEAYAYDYGKEFGKSRGISKSVPVVGEPVGFILIHENGGRNLTFHDNTDDLADGWSQHKLIIQPTTSITAQELDALRKDAERYRYLRKQHWSEAEICVVTNPKDAIKLGCYCPSSVRLDSAIDSAMQDRQS